MNIAIFASAFHPHFGGVEELVRQLALELRRKRHTAIVLTNRWPRKLPRYEVIDGIPVFRVPFRGPDAGLRSRVTFRITRDRIHREVNGILRRHDIDVLHVQCVSSNAYYALHARRKLSLPLVVTLQGELTMDATRLFERSEFARTILRQCLTEAEAVTACSQKTLEDAEQFFGGNLEGRKRVIFNGISTGDFTVAVPYRHPKPYVFGIGRMVPQKGFDLLLRAFAATHAPEYDLILAGNGSEMCNLKKLAAELRLEDRVHFLGQADRTQVAQLFAGCSFFVLPSRLEPFGIVNLEAMAARKAVIATRVGGVSEVVQDGCTGILVEKEDIRGMSAAIQRLCGDEDLRLRLGAAGRLRSRLFSWPIITDQYLGVYDRTCGMKVGSEYMPCTI